MICRMLRAGLALPIALVAVMAAVSAPGIAQTQEQPPAQAQPHGASPPQRENLQPDEQNTVDVVRRVSPSVVAIHIRHNDTPMHPMAGEGQLQGGGSGFLIEGNVIVTNFHVVVGALGENGLDLERNASISVSFVENPGHQIDVRVHGANPDYDLALLEFVDPEDVPDVQPLPLGDSDLVEAGHKAIAIGAPFGLQSSVTTGIVSAIEREHPGLVGIEIPFIQTDAAINVGNSGGPLLNSAGEVIGINNAILAMPGGGPGFVGVGFAVPINLLQENLRALRAGGMIGVAAQVATIDERARLGVSVPLAVEDYPAPVRAQLEFPEHGVVIAEITPGGPADQAGLEAATSVLMIGQTPLPIGGDIITAIGGQDVRRAIDVQQVILEHEPGDTVTLTVWRDGQEREVNVTLQVVPAS
jgi:serine protease Do